MTSTQKARNFEAATDDEEEEELEGSTEADPADLSRFKSSRMESTSVGVMKEKRKKLKGNNYEVDSEHLSDELKEEGSGTEEGQKFGAVGGNFHVEVSKTKISRSPMQSQRKKSKKVLFERGTRLLPLTSIFWLARG